MVYRLNSGLAQTPIYRDEALRIASQALANNVREITLVCHDTQPLNCHIYKVSTEPCWYIYAPWNDGKDVWAIRSSRVILVGKLAGTIHYDASAGDEG
jgi:hypothetical protein